jgi:hypothetical protein
MGLLDNVGGILKQAGDGIASAAEHTSKAASDAWNTAVEDAKAGANAVATAVRDADAKKQQIGAWIDAKEQQLEHKVDEGRAWLRENGGVAGKVASAQIGLVEGIGTSLYGAGKGIVQLADGVTSLTNPLEWAANPGANVARLKSAGETVETLGKIANLAQPTSWLADPKGNAQLAGKLWDSAATSFNKDPAKFVGNAAGTVGLFFVPGGQGGAVAGDVGKAAVITGDIGKAAAITGDVGKAAAVTGDVGKATAITGDVGKAATVTGDVGKATAITGDVGKATAVAEDTGKAAAVTRNASRPGGAGSGPLVGEPFPENPFPQVKQREANWCGAACGQMSAGRLGTEVDQATLAASRHFEPRTVVGHTVFEGGFQTKGLEAALTDVAPVPGRVWRGGTISQDISTPERLGTHLKGYIDNTQSSVILRVEGGDHWIIVDSVLQDGRIAIRDPRNTVSTLVTPQQLIDMGPTGDAVFSLLKR